MSSNRRRGQALALFALVLPVMLALMGLGLDGAHLFLERRDAQGAADLAALAAAKNLPGGVGSAERAAATNDAITIAATNGYTIGAGSVSFPNDSQARVTIDTQVQMTFASVLGITTMDVSATAVAKHLEAVAASAGAAGPTVLGTDEICDGDKQTVFMSGADIVVDGTVISTSGTQWSGDNGLVTGDYTFVEDPKLVAGSGCVGTLVNEADIQDPPTVFPYSVTEYAEFPEPYWGYTVSQICDPTFEAAGSSDGLKTVYELGDKSIDISHGSFVGIYNDLVNGEPVIRPGIYCLRGLPGPDGEYGTADDQDPLLWDGLTLKVGTADASGDVTLVAETISISGARAALTPYWNGLQAYAWGGQREADPRWGIACPSCSDSGKIAWSGKDGTWLGLLFAPNGEVHMSGARALSSLGALWGKFVFFSGKEVTLSGEGLLPAPDVEGAPEVLALIE